MAGARRSAADHIPWRKLLACEATTKGKLEARPTGKSFSAAGTKKRAAGSSRPKEMAGEPLSPGWQDTRSKTRMPLLPCRQLGGRLSWPPIHVTLGLRFSPDEPSRVAPTTRLANKQDEAQATDFVCHLSASLHGPSPYGPTTAGSPRMAAIYRSAMTVQSITLNTALR